MRVAAIQLDLAWEDRATNLARAEPWILTAASAGARLVVLPEMFPCGFTMQTARVREVPLGPSTQFLLAAAKAHGIWICGSIPELPANATLPFNTLVLASPAGEIHRYRKLHPFTNAREHEHYGAGDALLTVTIEELRLTFFICYDLRFGNVFWETASQSDGYVVVANWPAKRREHWRTLLRARAIENQAYVVGVNRVGLGHGIEYAGDSAIVDPWGEPLATASTQATMLLADLDAAVVARTRAGFPVLSDRRPTPTLL